MCISRGRSGENVDSATPPGLDFGNMTKTIHCVYVSRLRERERDRERSRLREREIEIERE